MNLVTLINVFIKIILYAFTSPEQFISCDLILKYWIPVC